MPAAAEAKLEGRVEGMMKVESGGGGPNTEVVSSWQGESDAVAGRQAGGGGTLNGGSEASEDVE